MNTGRCQGTIVSLDHSFLQTLKSFKIIFREFIAVIQKACLITIVAQHFKNRLSVKALLAYTDGNTQGCMKDIVAKMLVLAYAVKPLKGTGSTHLGCYMETVGCSVAAKKTMTDSKGCVMNGGVLDGTCSQIESEIPSWKRIVAATHETGEIQHQISMIVLIVHCLVLGIGKGETLINQSGSEET